MMTRIAAGAGAKGALYTLPSDHTYLVLAGTANVQLGTDNFTAAPETLVLVPAGTPHRIWNAGAAQATVFEVIAAPPPMAPLASLYTKAAAKTLGNAASYVRVAPKLGQLAGGTGHDSLNERILADRSTGSQNVLVRLNDVLPGGGRTEPHMHPFDQVYFIRGGTLTVQYGMTTLEAGANTLVVLPRGVVHNNGNKGTGPQSIVTLLLPEPEKGQPMGSGVLQIQGRGGQ
jgi:mannose-6-phosphate isomerase-like protein (cupin superfamily)